MKKRNLFSILGTGLFMLSTIASCGSAGSINDSLVEIPCEDKYRTMYQIMPYSFADSDGDGIGDLQGIIDKLDYIDDLGFNGLWLTPVHESTTYHKYDVKDYKSIDPTFGTIETYKNLVNECHERGMTILLDLVFNHTSDEHEWFERSYAAHVRENTEDQYFDYYVWQEGGSCPEGYSTRNGYHYEARFWSKMPDLNLQSVIDNPTGPLANDLKEVMRYWLEDIGVDGFRLDAVTSYFTGNPIGNQNFLKWLSSTAKSIKSDVYIVGEGSWGGFSNENLEYCKTGGIDSCFNFETSTAGGFIASAINRQNASYYCGSANTMIKKYEGTEAIPAPFIANHDNGRMVGFLSAKGDEAKMKFGYSLLQMLPGVTYHYYGDEIGMAAYQSPGASEVIDENKRQPMPWGDSYTCKPILQSGKVEDSVKYPFGNIPTNQNNESSLINFIKDVNKVRNSFLEITHGTMKNVYESGDQNLCAIERTYNGDTILMVVNASTNRKKEYVLGNSVYTTLSAELCADGNEGVSYNGSSVVLPPRSIAILTKGE